MIWGILPHLQLLAFVALVIGIGLGARHRVVPVARPRDELAERRSTRQVDDQ